MGVYQEASIYVTVPAAQVTALAAAIRATNAEEVYGEKLDADDNAVVGTYLVRTEGGDPDGCYEIDPDGSVAIGTSVYGNLSYDYRDVEELYAAHGAEGTIEGTCEGDVSRTRLAGGKVASYSGDVFYLDDPTDPVSVIVQSALEFVRGTSTEQEMIDVLTKSFPSPWLQPWGQPVIRC